MDPTTRLLYLEAMGIPVWELRQRDSAALSPESIHLEGEHSKPPQIEPTWVEPVQVESLPGASIVATPAPEVISPVASETMPPVAQASTAIIEPAASVDTGSGLSGGLPGKPESQTDLSPNPATVQPTPVAEGGIEHWLCDLCLREIDPASSPPFVPNQQNANSAYTSGSASSGLLVLEAPLAPEISGLGATGLSAPANKMLDAMLSAIGRSRRDILLGSVSGPSAEHGLPLWQPVSTEQSQVVLLFVQPGFHQDTDALLSETQPVKLALASRANVSSTVHCVVSYHPDFLLLNPSLKRSVWEDLKLVSSLLGASE